MKKITFFINNMYTDGGTERVVSLIANELAKKNKVEIISLCKTAEKPFYQLDKKIKLYNILKEEPKNLVKSFIKVRSRVKNFMKNYTTDVFISAGMRYIALTIFMRKRVKFIAWEHYNSAITKFGSLGWIGRHLAARYAHKIVVLTQKDKINNIKMFRSKEDKIEQIYNPIQVVKIEDEYNIESKKIVSCGRICNQKGYDMLVEIADKVFNKHPDWEWHIYGDGPDREKIEKAIKAKGLEKNVILKGRTNKMNQLYKEYAMFALTSRYEGFAMVNIEAHFAKLPIVSFNCNCGPDEIIQDGVNGYIVDCFDIDKMAERINTLIENRDLRQEMSDNTLLDKDKLKMENIIKKWEKII